MSKLTTEEVREYPWGFEPQEGYEYVEVADCCGAKSHYGHPLCQVVEDPPAGAEPVSNAVLTDSGWRRLYRLPQPEWKRRVILAIRQYAVGVLAEEKARFACVCPREQFVIYGDTQLAGQLVACDDLEKIIEALELPE